MSVGHECKEGMFNFVVSHLWQRPFRIIVIYFNILALFLLRDPSFLDEVPEEHKKDFIDSDKLAPYKLKILKKMIRDRFPVSDVLHVFRCVLQFRLPFFLHGA